MMMEIYGSGGTTYDKTTTTLSDAQKGHPLAATSNKENSFDLWNRDLLCPFGNQQTEALEHLSREPREKPGPFPVVLLLCFILHVVVPRAKVYYNYAWDG